MYLMAGLLVVGFFANLAVRPVADRYYMSDEELARERGLAAAGRGMTDCINSPGPEYCCGRGRRRGVRHGRSVAVSQDEPAPGGAAGQWGLVVVGVGPGWSSAALGGLEHAAQGGGAVPVGGPAQNLTPHHSAKLCIE